MSDKPGLHTRLRRWYVVIGLLLIFGFCVTSFVVMRRPISKSMMYVGNITMSEGNYAAAEEQYDWAIQIDPDNWEAYYKRGLVFTKTHRYQEAKEDFDQGVRLNPKYGPFYANRGWVETEMGDPDQAIKDYDLALTLDPDYAEGYDLRGYAYYKRGDLDLALDDFNQAIHLGREIPDIYHRRANAYFQKGDLTNAFRDINIAIKLDPREEFYFTRSLYYLSLDPKDSLNALADLDQVIKLNPEYTDAYYQRGLVHDMLKNGREALQDYQYFILHHPEHDQYREYAERRVTELSAEPQD